MAKTIEVLKLEANTIKNEVNEGANTATRIGGTIFDVVEKIDDIYRKTDDAHSIAESAFSVMSDITGQFPLVTPALYDDQMSSSNDGNTVILTSVKGTPWWEQYGVKLPSSLVNGETYTLCGKVVNKTTIEQGLKMTNTLFGENETVSKRFFYGLQPNATKVLNDEFVYSSSHPYLVITRPREYGESIELTLYVRKGKCIQDDIEELQSIVEDHTDTLTKKADTTSVQGIEKDIYGGEYLSELAMYGEDMEVEYNGHEVKFTKINDDRTWAEYGLKLPSTLVSGKTYRIRGTMYNGANTNLQLSIKNGLWGETSSTQIRFFYGLTPGSTYNLDAEFVYNPNYRYLVCGMPPDTGDYWVLSVQIVEKEGIIDVVNDLQNSKMQRLQAINSGMKVSDGSLKAAIDSGGTTKFVFTQEGERLHIVCSGNAGLYKIEWNCTENGGVLFEPNKKYAIFLDIDAKSIEMQDSQEQTGLAFFFNKPDYTADDDSISVRIGETVQSGVWRNFKTTQFIQTGNATKYTSSIMSLTRYNPLLRTEEMLNLYINRLLIYEVPDEISYLSALEWTSLLGDAGEAMQIGIAARALPSKNILYGGMQLNSLGDSLPETSSFQPYVAHAMGMHWDSTEGQDCTMTWEGTQVQYIRSIWGGTRVVPVVETEDGTSRGRKGSIYIRARYLKYRKPDVLLILAGYNDTKAGEPFTEGGTATQPLDYGINDAPYYGEEVDLRTDKTKSVPSFGACYRGMIERLQSDMPWLRIVVCGIPRGSGETNLVGTSNDWVSAKNHVIETIANEYGLPYVDLAKNYGVNKFNWKWMTKDGLHFGDFGGRRVAMEILAKAF